MLMQQNSTKDEFHDLITSGVFEQIEGNTQRSPIRRNPRHTGFKLYRLSFTREYLEMNDIARTRPDSRVSDFSPTGAQVDKASFENPY